MVECSVVLAEHPNSTIFTGFPPRKKQASVAQLAEQLICNQQVVGSSPSAGSVISHVEPEEKPGLQTIFYAKSGPNRTFLRGKLNRRKRRFSGGFPERSKGSDCKSDGIAFAGSNPAPPTCGHFTGKVSARKRKVRPAIELRRGYGDN